MEFCQSEKVGILNFLQVREFWINKILFISHMVSKVSAMHMSTFLLYLCKHLKYFRYRKKVDGVHRGKLCVVNCKCT